MATGVGGVHGFPVTLTSFIGRTGAVREVAGLLEEYRLVTVTGPGGSGKTIMPLGTRDILDDSRKRCARPEARLGA